MWCMALVWFKKHALLKNVWSFPEAAREKQEIIRYLNMKGTNIDLIAKLPEERAIHFLQRVVLWAPKKQEDMKQKW